MPSVVTCPIAAETRQPARHLSSPVRFLNQWHAGLRGDMLALASGDETMAQEAKARLDRDLPPEHVRRN